MRPDIFASIPRRRQADAAPAPAPSPTLRRLWLLGACLSALSAPLAAQTTDVRVELSAATSQFHNPIQQAYSGPASGLPALSVSTLPARPALGDAETRYAAAGYSGQTLSVETVANPSGIGYPSSSAGYWNYSVRVLDTPALQTLLAANGGQPLALVARFGVDLRMTDAGLTLGQGVWDQSVTSVELSIGADGRVAGHETASFWGEARLYDGPYVPGVLSTQGLFSAADVNAGRISLDIPFYVDAQGLTTSFTARMSATAMSLYEVGTMGVFSALQLVLPLAADISLAGGGSALAAGQSVEVTAVPEPAPGALMLAGLVLLVAVHAGRRPLPSA